MDSRFDVGFFIFKGLVVSNRLEMILAVDTIRYGVVILAVQMLLVIWMASVEPKETGLPFLLFAACSVALMFILQTFGN